MNKKTKENLDKIDKKLLNIIQKDLPLKSRPFLEIAKKLKIDETEVITRIKKLKKSNYIRRMGGIFSSKKLGYKSILLAAKVKEDKFYEITEKINQYQGVTHNYRRNHEYNLWFTLIAESENRLENIINKISNLQGIRMLRKLPIKRSFKLKVDLNMKPDKKEKGRSENA